jgi:hypothetical protein
VKDPWAVEEPGFEKYTGPTDDGFAPFCTKASDLRSFLRSDEAQELLGEGRREAVLDGPVMLPNGTPAQLIRRTTDEWELMVHLKRDLYAIFRARSRDEVLRLAVSQGA